RRKRSRSAGPRARRFPTSRSSDLLLSIGINRRRRVPNAVDATAIHADDLQDAGVEGYLITGGGHAFEHAHHVTAHGVVHVSFWHAHAGATTQFIRAQFAGECDRVAPLNHTGTAAVMLVSD